MELIMAILKVKCDCGMTVEANVGDRMCNNKLHWFQSYYCNNCGNTSELDGVGNIPPDIETAIMEQDGRCGLFLNNSDDRQKAEFLLKKRQSDNLEKYKLFIEKKTDEILYGTKNEILLTEKYLKSKGGIDCLIKYY